MDEDDQVVGVYIAAGKVSHGVVVAEEVLVNGAKIDGEGHSAGARARGSAWQGSGPPLSPPPAKSELLELECYEGSCIISSSTSG